MSSPHRIRVTLEPKDGWPRTRRGVGSEVVCVVCGTRCRARTHAEARNQLRMHRLMEHT